MRPHYAPILCAHIMRPQFQHATCPQDHAEALPKPHFISQTDRCHDLDVFELPRLISIHHLQIYKITKNSLKTLFLLLLLLLL